MTWWLLGTKSLLELMMICSLNWRLDPYYHISEKFQSEFWEKSIKETHLKLSSENYEPAVQVWRCWNTYRHFTCKRIYWPRSLALPWLLAPTCITGTDNQQRQCWQPSQRWNLFIWLSMVSSSLQWQNSYYIDVTRALRYLILPTTGLFVQRLYETNHKEYTKTIYLIHQNYIWRWIYPRY